MTTLTLNIDRTEVFHQMFRRSEYVGFRQCGGLNGLKEKSASERDSQLLDGYWKELYSRLVSHLAAEFTFIDNSQDASRLQFEILVAGTSGNASPTEESTDAHGTVISDSVSTAASAWFCASLLYYWLRTVGFSGYAAYKEDADLALESLLQRLRTLTAPPSAIAPLTQPTLTRRSEPL